MKKTITVLCIALFSLFISGCDDTIYHWEFQQDQSEIIGLYIVDAETSKEFEIIKEIPLEKKEELINDITNIEYKKYGWDPHDANGTCFVIKYRNEEYDIISWIEPSHYYWKEYDGERRLTGYISWLECDKNEFEQLIKKWNE